MSKSLHQVNHAASTTRQTKNVHLAIIAHGAMPSVHPSAPTFLQLAGIPVLEADDVSVLHRAANTCSARTGSGSGPTPSSFILPDPKPEKKQSHIT